MSLRVTLCQKGVSCNFEMNYTICKSLYNYGSIKSIFFSISSLLLKWNSLLIDRLLNGVLRRFQQYFSHITTTPHIISVFPGFHQYQLGALKCLAQGHSNEKKKKKTQRTQYPWITSQILHHWAAQDPHWATQDPLERSTHMEIIYHYKKSIDPCQPARTAQADMGRYLFFCRSINPPFHRARLMFSHCFKSPLFFSSSLLDCKCLGILMSK